MKKISFISLLILLFVSQLFAQRVSESRATQTCQRFLMDRDRTVAVDDLKLAEVYTQENGETALYRFQLPDVGFVVVSASLTTPPVLAYSFDHDFEMIPPVRDLFDLYVHEIAAAEKAQWNALPKAAANWNRYLAETYVPKTTRGTSGGPLLTTEWNQNKFYNTYCPWDVNSNEYYDYRVPNGCVACASAQIINYHRYPKSGVGRVMYIPAGYPKQEINFPDHIYHYDAMCNEPTSYANEVAKLAYHFGIAIRMQYTPDGSGAISDVANEKLVSVFLYDPDITTYYRDSYTDTFLSEYVDVLKNEIDLRRPVYYSGKPQNSNSGHAYVLDGYDEDDLMHLNYGWGGSSNGYYAIDNFVSGPTHYDFNSRAVVHIYPSGIATPEYCQGHQRNTASFGYVADGSPTTKPYQSNPDCSWMVAVPSASAYSFKFDRLDLKEGDYVTIYNGPTEASGVLVTLTGSEVPAQTYHVSADSVLITFVGNNNNTDHYGFLISYSSTLPATRSCDEVTNLVNVWNDVLTDGTGEGETYLPETNCTWNIRHTFISGYAFAFPKFNLGYGDFVDVYNASTNPPTLYKRFDIYDQPEGVYYVDFKRMSVNFVSDNWDQGEGFQLDYYALAAVEDYNGLEDLRVYPNPATNYVNVEFSLTQSETITLQLMDLTGKVLRQNIVEGNDGVNQHTLDIQGMSRGMYMLEISTPNGKSVRKVIVQ